MRGWRIALVASLLLNLFLAGVLIGGAAWLRERRPLVAAGALRVAGSELPRDQRRAFRRALREQRQMLRDQIEDGRAQRLRAAALLRQPLLDQAATIDALDRARAADMTVRAAVEHRAVAFAAGLPPADRARLADAMERRTQRPARSR